MSKKRTPSQTLYELSSNAADQFDSVMIELSKKAFHFIIDILSDKSSYKYPRRVKPHLLDCIDFTISICKAADKNRKTSPLSVTAYDSMLSRIYDLNEHGLLLEDNFKLSVCAKVEIVTILETWHSILESSKALADAFKKTSKKYDHLFPKRKGAMCNRFYSKKKGLLKIDWKYY